MDFESFVYQNDFAFFIYAVKSLLHSAHFPLIKPMERMKSAIADKPELTRFLSTRLQRKQKTDTLKVARLQRRRRGIDASASRLS